MAVEKVFELATEEPPDLIVLDTPPTQHALDFLEAPQRILDVLNSRVLTILQNPTSILTNAGSRLSQVVLGAILRAIEQFTGLTLIREVADLVRAFDGMIDGLRARAHEVEQLLRAPDTAFLLVTVASTVAVRQTEAFYRTLEKAGIPCAGVIVNRVLPRDVFDREPPPADDVNLPGLSPVLTRKLVQTFGDLHTLAADEYAAIERLRQRDDLGGRVAEVPAFPNNLASLADVARFARVLFLDGAPTGECAPC
jgi:anion-transporting  ArsA/GET3 family ATPase